jgi:hypothetical protein
MDFLGMAGDLWDLLILTLLPLISILMAFIMIYKILDAMQTTIPKFIAKHLPRSKSRR